MKRLSLLIVTVSLLSTSPLVAFPDSGNVADTLFAYFNGFGSDSFFRNGAYRVGRAISLDNGVHWKKYPSDPLIGDQGLMKEQFAHSPYVIHLLSKKKGDQFICYYRRQNAINDDVIGIAVSNDGIHFRSFNPTLIQTDVAWRDGGVSFPYVFVDSLETNAARRFKMLYSGWSGIDNNYHVKIGFGFSADGLSWTFPAPDTLAIDSPPAVAPLGFYNGFVYIDSSHTYHLYVEAARLASSYSLSWEQGGEEAASIWHFVSKDFLHWKPAVNRAVMNPDGISATLLKPLKPGDTSVRLRNKQVFLKNTPLRWIEFPPGRDPTYGKRSSSKVQETVVLDDSTQIVSFSPPIPFDMYPSLSVKSVIADRLYPSDFFIANNQITAYVVGFNNDYLYETMVIATGSLNGVLTFARNQYPVLPFGINCSNQVSQYWNGMSSENLRIMRTYHLDSLIVVNKPVGPLPSEYRLDPAYPNPFNPSTTIRYSLPQASTASLRLYNMLGQLVSDLGSTYQTAGEHTVTIDGSAIPSGMYFLIAQLGNHNFTQKLLLLK